ncbi:uncharacterized protein LOC122034393 [Zingiber officinale]|uniref:Uncharacterized protein n=1 Tax=Zingiber officinale TaxID=94328 RepID=A0A8J5C2A9_ZINOF|nr:uncharacterized protein LOC122034393 [Zingiber officinale]KAG6469451.1 hypothetical protein ZIOFF_074168 [Zingiber officinale]
MPAERGGAATQIQKGVEKVDMGVEAGDGWMSLSETVFSFLEEGGSSDGSSHGDRGGDDAFESGDEEGGRESSAVENKAFWESQQQLLHEALSRISSAEVKLLQRTKDAVEKMQAKGIVCSCSNRMAKECRNCALAYIAKELREIGYDSGLCKSKWKRSPDIPSGEHTYIDVKMETKSGKKGPVRLVIEQNFRAEFEMARSSQEYNRLVMSLPEIFVGKAEKLRGVVKIVCAAAKKCMKDNKMHMAPWRKHKYMQSKWLGTSERIVGPAMDFPAATVSDQRQPPKLRASMLTFDLHRMVVEVV